MSDSTSIQRARNSDPGLTQRLGRVLLDAGRQALLLHRLAHALRKRGLPLVPELLRRLNIFLTGADIHTAAKIGRQVTLIHPVGIVIGKGAVVEDQCEIFGGVVLGGLGGLRDEDGFPKIAFNTVVCVGAKVLGPISVGPHATVSAGAVVLTSVPAYALVAGVPAQVKKIYTQEGT